MDNSATSKADPALLHMRSVQPFAVWLNGFTETELDVITAYGDQLNHDKATIEGRAREEVYDSIRVTRTAWIGQNPQTSWIYDRMARIARHLNDLVYRLDLTTLTENLQYTVYEAAEGSHYDWHVDHSTLTPSPRKLSLSLQLSDPADYDGCELQIHAGNTIETTPNARGTVILFPSYALHRVTPIVSGTRKALVSWISGPLLR
jgi:PKHD-type hydroxylase